MKTLILFLSISVSALSFGGCKKQYTCDCKGEKIMTGTSYDKDGKPQPVMSYIGIPIGYEDHTDKVKEKNAEKSCASKSSFTETTNTTKNEEQGLTTVHKETTEITCELK